MSDHVVGRINFSQIEKAHRSAVPKPESNPSWANTHRDLGHALEEIKRLRAEGAECICRGNWRSIIKECEPLLDGRYRDNNGELHTFFGVVLSSDDYYYGFRRDDGETVLLSCVGSIEAFGMERVSGRQKP